MDVRIENPFLKMYVKILKTAMDVRITNVYINVYHSGFTRAYFEYRLWGNVIFIRFYARPVTRSGQLYLRK